MGWLAEGVKRDAAANPTTSQPAVDDVLGRAQLPIAVVTSVIVAASYLRLFLGVDFTDEAFYVADTVRLVQGARPFVDETNITQQTTSMLMYPFVGAYHAAIGREGLILFTRHIFFLATVGATVAVYAPLRAVLESDRLARVVCLAPIAFVPFGIPNISYDSLAVLLLTVGFWSMLLATESDGWAYSSAACEGAAVFVYPPLVVPVAVHFVLATTLLRVPPRKLWPAAFGVVFLAATVAWAGVHIVHDDITQSSRYLGQAGGAAKAHWIARTAWHGYPLRWLALGLALIAWFLVRRSATLAVVAVIALLATAVPVHAVPVQTDSTLALVRNLAILSPAIAAIGWRNPAVRRVFLLVALPGIVAGSVTAFSSANGALNFGVGAFVAALGTLVMTCLVLRDAVVDRRAAAYLPLAFAVAAMATFVVLKYSYVYGDGSLSSLRHLVRSGAYAGLLTTGPKVRFLDTFRDAARPYGENCRALVVDGLPAGYLLTTAKGATNAVWTFPVANGAPEDEPAYRKILLTYLNRTRLPDVIFKVLRGPLEGTVAENVGYVRDDPLARVIRTDYVRVFDRDGVAAFKQRGESCNARDGRSR